MLDIKNMLQGQTLQFYVQIVGVTQTKLRRQEVHDFPIVMAAIDCRVDYKMGGVVSTMQKHKLERDRKAKVEGKT